VPSRRNQALLLRCFGRCAGGRLAQRCGKPLTQAKQASPCQDEVPRRRELGCTLQPSRHTTRNPWTDPDQPFLSLSRFLSLKGFTPSTLSSRTQFPARACPCWQARPGTHRSDFTGPGSPGCPSEPALYSVRGEEGWSVCCQQTLGTEYTLALSEPSVPRYELGDRRQTGQNYACGNACPRRLHAP
jgi:hypothetical protein